MTRTSPSFALQLTSISKLMRGSVSGASATTALDPTTLLKRLTETDALVAGQDVGKMSYLVHDVCAAGAPNDSRQPGSVHSAVHSSSFDRLPSSHASAWISVKSRVDAVASGMLCR